VAGSYEVVAVARVGKNEDLAELVTERLVKLHGIVASETLIAFRSYSHKDVEAGFQLGGT
jgi:DNA-binding Lrp family transcriptional regulator